MTCTSRAIALQQTLWLCAWFRPPTGPAIHQAVRLCAQFSAAVLECFSRQRGKLLRVILNRKVCPRLGDTPAAHKQSNSAC